LKQCTNCRGNLADFVAVCPYCGVSQPVVQAVPAQWAGAPQNSNMAIASLVCGVLFMCAPASIAAIILGHLALANIKQSANRMAGKGMATAGLVLGYAGLALTTIYVVFLVFTVRNTFSHDIPTNETAAIATMRMYDQTLKAYAAKCPQQGYPATLVSLGPGKGDCARANLVSDPRLAGITPVFKGYMFRYNTGVRGGEHIASFALVANPIQPGMTGKRYFYLDEGSVLRQANSQIIGPRSDPVDQPGASSNTTNSGNHDVAYTPAAARNEFLTIANMIAYNRALSTYARKCPQQGFPATLRPLGPGKGDCAHANLVEANLAGEAPVSNGYTFQYTTGTAALQHLTVFVLVARPLQPNITGKRYFYLDESGVIRHANSQIIGPRSEPLSHRLPR